MNRPGKHAWPFEQLDYPGVGAKQTFTRNVEIPDSYYNQETKAYRRTTITGTIELTIDIDALAQQMAYRAFRSKAKKSRMASGKIVAKAHTVSEVDR